MSIQLDSMEAHIKEAALNLTGPYLQTLTGLDTGEQIAWFDERQHEIYKGLGITIVLGYLFKSLVVYLLGFKAPIVGYRHWWEPGWLVGLRFGFNATPMAREGYAKFKNSYFKLRRNDDDLLIIPRHHVNDLRNISETKLSGMDAHMRNMLAEYTFGNMHMIETSDLHRRVIIRKLNPLLGKLVPALKDELDYATTLIDQISGPEAWKWTPESIDEITISFVSRMSARIFVGPELCRNKDWLYLSVHYTENLGWTRNLLRLFPKFTRPIAARCMPTYWGIYSNLRAAQRLLRPLIDGRRQSMKDPDWKKPNDALQWMLDDARPDEAHPNDIAHREVILAMAAIHTTSISVTHFIYDLCAHPEYFEPLREEIIQVIREEGGINKSTLNKLRRMDSFLKESQRVNPPFVCKYLDPQRRNNLAFAFYSVEEAYD